jgi:hypothetical protein
LTDVALAFCTAVTTDSDCLIGSQPNKRLMLPGLATQKSIGRHMGAHASTPFRRGTRDPLSAITAGSIAASPLAGGM